VTSWKDRESSECWATCWNSQTIKAYFDRQHHRSAGTVADPPPIEVERDGVRFYLAHFNARRAWYSSKPPPIEPSAD